MNDNVKEIKEIEMKKNENTIKEHSFKEALERIKQFEKNVSKKMKISKVETEGWFFGFNDHRVTGSELNKIVKEISYNFNNITETNNNIILELSEVYKALEILDKEYIKSIVANVKSIEKTSDDVRKQQKTLENHHDVLKEQQIKLKEEQFKLDETIKNIEKIVNVLKIFKNELDNFSHLKDVDTMYYELKSSTDIIIKLEEMYKDSENKFNHEIEELKIQLNKNNKMIKYSNIFIIVLFIILILFYRIMYII